MLYSTPPITEDIGLQMEELDRLRAALRREVTNPSPWLGTLRRLARATSAESSVSIEGFSVPEDEVVGIVSGAEPIDPDDEDRMALACYARAMDHVGVMALDPVFEWRDRVILDLHFDACSFQRDTSPGLWRTGPVGVTSSTGRLAYEAPEGDRVVPLM